MDLKRLFLSRSVAIEPRPRTFGNLLVVSLYFGAIHDADDVRHDSIEVEILGRIDGGDASLLEGLRVLRRDNAADDDGDVEAGAFHPRNHVAYQRHVRAREDR